MQHITVPLPDRLSPHDARRAAVEIEAVVNRITGALVDATVTDLALTEQERRVLARALDIALVLIGTLDEPPFTVDETIAVLALSDRIDPDNRAAIVAAALAETNGNPELTRPQEYAADAMAAEFGRSRVRHLSDGAVVIVGMTDDIERRSVCVERDGTERWRS